MLKTKFVVEGFSDEICLTHAPSAIDGTKLRFLFVKKLQQFTLFLFTPDNHNDICFIKSAANIAKKFL